jgi:hypothetical protein
MVPYWKNFEVSFFLTFSEFLPKENFRDLITGKIVLYKSNNKITRVVFLREQKHTSDGLWPHECVSAPSEITRVWFYIYPMPPKTTETQLLILEFHTPSSP